MRLLKNAGYRSVMLVLLLLVTAGVVGGCRRSGEQAWEERQTPLFSMAYYGRAAGLEEHQRLLYGFIVMEMTGPFGVFTNWRETEQSGEAASGHETLSESAGLLLRYLAHSGKQAEFNSAWRTAKAVFDRDKLFSYRYSPLHDRSFGVNAAVDDLRLIRALYEAEEAFGGGGYRQEAESYGKRFYANNTPNGKLADFFEEATGQNSPTITLCYIDLKTLALLPVEKDGERQRLLAGMLNIAKNGYISDLLPLYETSYNDRNKRYSGGEVRTTESLLTVLALAEVGQEEKTSLAFIRDKVMHEGLYGAYNRDGTPASSVQSAAIYAIAAMIASETEDRELYDAAIGRMEQFRIQDPASPLYGGFGDLSDPSGAGAYSFDNLMALLAYTY